MLGNFTCCPGGNNARSRLRGCERRFETQHGLDSRFVRQDVFQFAIGEEFVEQGHALASLRTSTVPMLRIPQPTPAADGGRYTRSRMTEMPWPTPMHMVHSAYRPCVRNN